MGDSFHNDMRQDTPLLDLFCCAVAFAVLFAATIVAYAL